MLGNFTKKIDLMIHCSSKGEMNEGKISLLQNESCHQFLNKFKHFFSHHLVIFWEQRTLKFTQNFGQFRIIRKACYWVELWKENHKKGFQFDYIPVVARSNIEQNVIHKKSWQQC